MTILGLSHSCLNPEELRSGHVHIWPVQLAASDAARERFGSFLCVEERDRAARFQFPRLRDSFILSRGALRLVQASYLRCPPEEVVFLYGEKGKPSLAGASPLRFNASHSGAIALSAFALSLELGVDVEQLRPMGDLQAIAARFFLRLKLQISSRLCRKTAWRASSGVGRARRSTSRPPATAFRLHWTAFVSLSCRGKLRALPI